MRNILIFSIIISLVVVLVFLPHDAYATAYLLDPTDQVHSPGNCGAVGGSWSGSICTISGSGGVAYGDSVDLYPGAELAISHGATFSISGLVSTEGDGTVTNAGTINISSTGYLANPTSITACGTITNSGTINSTNGEISNNCSFTNSGTIISTSSGYSFASIYASAGTFTNTGTIKNQFGSVLQDLGNTAGIITNSGTIDNAGFLQLYGGDTVTFAGPSGFSGSFTNTGTLNMNSTGTLTVGYNGIPTTLEISSGTLSIPSGVTLYISNSGTLKIDSGATVSDSGFITTQDGPDLTTHNPGGKIVNSGTINDNSGGTINNNCAYFNAGVCTILNNYSGTTPNTKSGTITNNAGGVILNKANSVLTNAGTITNAGNMTNIFGANIINYAGSQPNPLGGNITNNNILANSGMIVNNVNATIINNNQITNKAGATIVNYYTFTNNAAGTVTNSGNMTNNAGGTITNNNQITNNAGATITNNAGGTITNNNQIANKAGATIVNYNTFTNNAAGTVTNSGNMTNNAGGTITNNNQITNNAGATITNKNQLTNNSTGTITNNAGATMTNNAGATITNNNQISNKAVTPNGIINSGIITNITGSTISNTGTIANNSGATINNNENGDEAETIINNKGTLTNDGTINNDGTIELNSSGTITNDSGGKIINDHSGDIYNFSGTITNNPSGIITNDHNASILNSLGSTFTNGGTLNNNAEILNNGEFDILAGGIVNNNSGSNSDSEGGFITNDSGGLINDSGAITNGLASGSGDSAQIVNNKAGTIAVFSGGSITNNSNGIIRNTGDGLFTSAVGMIKIMGGTITNAGRILNEGGVITLSSGHLTNVSGGYIVNMNRYITSDGPVTIFNVVANDISQTIKYLVMVTNISPVAISADTGQPDYIIPSTGPAITLVGTTQTYVGTITNGGTISNAGTIYNGAGSVITNNSGANMTIASGGIINNLGTITNIGTLANSGTLGNICGGSVVGVISGNAAITQSCPRTTSTSIIPSPSSVKIGHNATFTVIVNDTTGGTPTTPTGQVSWSDGIGNGTFSPSGVCTLSNGSCQILYLPPLTGTIGISATYLGDNTHGTSYGNSTLSAVPPASPNPPTGVLASTVSSSSITVSWTGSAGATSYKVFRSQVSTGPFTVQVGTPTVSPFVDTGLTSGTKYYYEISATNSSGFSAPTYPPVNATTLPVVPTGLSSTVTSNSVLLSWTASPGATSYGVFSNSTGAFTLVGTSSTTFFNNTGLNPNTRHYYEVRATDAGGSSLFSGPISATTSPAIPTGILATPSSTSIKISWNNLSGMISYKIYRGTSPSGTFVPLLGKITSSPFVDVGLAPSTTYYYKITASNAVSTSAFSSAISATTYPLPPNMPTSVTVTALTSHSIQVSWKVSAGATSYTIFRLNAGMTVTQVGTVNAPTTIYVDNAVLPNTTYYYEVSATNPGGMSAKSVHSPAITSHPT